MKRLGMHVLTRAQHPKHQVALVVYGITREQRRVQAGAGGDEGAQGSAESPCLPWQWAG